MDFTILTQVLFLFRSLRELLPTESRMCWFEFIKPSGLLTLLPRCCSTIKSIASSFPSQCTSLIYRVGFASIRTKTSCCSSAWVRDTFTFISLYLNHNKFVLVPAQFKVRETKVLFEDDRQLRFH